MTKKSRMFPFITKCWNPVHGCEHGCVYCWARNLAETKLKDSPRYKDGFKPALVEKEFNRRFNKGDFVFVSDMGDLFGDWVPDEWILRVLRCIRESPEAKFLFLTKNPEKYSEFLKVIPRNCVLGATIESNRNYETLSKAPAQMDRLCSMDDLQILSPHERFISVEPIFEFDLDPLVDYMEDIGPWAVAIGYDNYNFSLPEPPLEKTKGLIDKLRGFTTVFEKTLRPAWFENIGEVI